MNQQTCNPALLDAFLKNDLNQSEEQMLTSHLDECSDCREKLESRAAERSVWREASHMLGGGILLSTAAISDIRSGTVRSPQIELVLKQLAPTDDPESLGRIGGYEVTGVVGAGGMGVVLKAHDLSLDRIVAIKVMSPHLASSGSARRRFAREAKAAAAVLHPNVIAIHSVASEDANPFLVMPYVRGASLQKRIDSQGPLPLKDTLRIGAQIAAGLAAAHEQGLVHRDIKPANILLEEGVERVTITDFGLARAVDDASMTCSGVIAGTPQYMSPEQTRGEPIDARSDLFSFGSVLYAMCAGRSPFRAETTYGVLHRIANDNPTPVCDVNSDVPEWLGHIIERLMAKRPEVRFETAAQVAELLEGCLAHVQQPAVIPLPLGVQALAAQSQLRAGKIPKPNRLKAIHQRIPPFAKYIAAAAGAVALFFAGILIVLELGKGTLTIESELDDVPIRIVQGKDVIKELTVSKSGKSIQIAAGNYEVEIGGQFDELSLDKGAVTLSRGGNDVVRIVRTSEGAAKFSRTLSSQAMSFEAPFQGRLSWGDGIHEKSFLKKGDFIAELIEFDPDLLEQLSNRLSAAKLNVEASQTFVRVSEESLKARRGNMEVFESQLKAYEQVRSQIAAAVAATIASVKNKIAAQQAELAEHKAVLEQAQTEFAQQKELFDQALISKLKFQEAEQKVTVAGARVTKGEADVQAAENDLIAQQNEGEAKEKKAQVEVDSATSQLLKARVEFARAEGELEKAGLDLKKAKKEVVELEIKLTQRARQLIHAPSSGFVTKLCRNEVLKEGDVICLFWPGAANDEAAKDEAAKAWLRRPVVGSFHDGKSFQLAGHDGLFHCVMTNNSEALNRLLTVDKYDLDFSPGNGQWTLLQTALQRSCLETTSLLLQHGAKPNFASAGTPLPLELAKRSGRKELVTLVQKYLESNATNSQTNVDAQAAELQGNWRLVYQPLDGTLESSEVGYSLSIGEQTLTLAGHSHPYKLLPENTIQWSYPPEYAGIKFASGKYEVIDQDHVRLAVRYHESPIDATAWPKTASSNDREEEVDYYLLIRTKDAAVTVPPMEFDTLEDFLKPGRELFDKEMKQIDERLAKVVEGSAEHSLLTTKKKQLQQQWDLSVAQVKGMAAAAKAGKPVQLAPIVIPNNSRPWQAPMPDPLLGHDEDIAEVLAGTWQVKRYVTDGQEAPLDGATVTFSKNMMTMHFKLGDEEGDIQQVYRIGSDKIDIWHMDSGPDMRTALPYLGSYSLENDTLRICYHNRAMELETPQSRPPVQPGKGFIFLELQRKADE